MGFLITLIVLIVMAVLSKVFPAFFTKIFDFIFANNTVNIIILIFAIIGLIVIGSMIWRQITGGIDSFRSKK